MITYHLRQDEPLPKVDPDQMDHFYVDQTPEDREYLLEKQTALDQSDHYVVNLRFLIAQEPRARTEYRLELRHSRHLDLVDLVHVASLFANDDQLTRPFLRKYCGHSKQTHNYLVSKMKHLIYQFALSSY